MARQSDFWDGDLELEVGEDVNAVLIYFQDGSYESESEIVFAGIIALVEEYVALGGDSLEGVMQAIQENLDANREASPASN